MQKRIHVYYTGRVQGVGFRFTARDIASSLGITGWVKNLGSRQVELAGEAEEGLLRDFLGRINQQFSGYIQDVDIDWLAATGEFKDFRIEF